MSHRRHPPILVAAIGVLTLMAAALDGIYMRQDVENVPVARLVANLERDLAANPKDADIHLRLARLYAMAYFANEDELPATALGGKDKPAKQEVWFGHEPNLVPGQVAPGTTRSDAAKAYLQKSVNHYKTAVDLESQQPHGPDWLRVGARTDRQQGGRDRRVPAGHRTGVAEGAGCEDGAAGSAVLYRGSRALPDPAARSEA